jgi:hypothetical protein
MEMMALRAIKNFFENFSPSQVFCVVTHCDLDRLDPDAIEDKRKSFEKYGGFEVKKENMIFFNNTADSLQPLIDKLTPGNMNFASDLDKKCAQINKELAKAYDLHDAENQTNYKE